MTSLRKMTIDDLWALNEIGANALSPDGRCVAYVVHSDDNAEPGKRDNSRRMVQ